uniref:Uncharacterized protein n=1 Tax=Octopus bimaculoides TaxID=37653 RepID=A0A0L8HVD5_OCTBM
MLHLVSRSKTDWTFVEKKGKKKKKSSSLSVTNTTGIYFPVIRQIHRQDTFDKDCFAIQEVLLKKE